MSFFEKLVSYANGAAILRDWLGSNTMPVDVEVAQRRANTCLRCPQNVSGIKLTEAIAEEIKKQIEFKRHLELHVYGEKALRTCAVCDCNNRLQIWCPDKLFQNHYTRADAVRYPKECWKRTLIEAGVIQQQAGTGPNRVTQNTNAGSKPDEAPTSIIL